MRSRIITITVVIVFLLCGAVLLGCAPGSAGSSEFTGVERVAAQYDLHLVGEPSISDAPVPEDLDTVPWGYLVIAMEDAGYDLDPYAGSTLTAYRCPLEETQDGLALTLHVFEADGEVVGAYLSLTADDPIDQPIPGVMSLNQLDSRPK